MSYSILLGKKPDGTYVVLSQSNGVVSPNSITISGHVHSDGDANDFITVQATGVEERSYNISVSAQAPYPVNPSS
jgi:hypothetical protein